MVTQDNWEYYLSEVYYKKAKSGKIKHKIMFYSHIFQWKNREDILNKIKTKQIDWNYDDIDFKMMKNDLMYFRKVHKIKKA